MIDKTAAKMKSDGWKMVETTGFLTLIGPLWQRVADNVHEYALITEDKHHNRRGLVQGGLLITTALLVLVNIGVDVCYALLDPRVRYDGA